MATHSLKVLEKRNLTPYTFVIRMERKDFYFQTGQYLSLGLKGHLDQREYSIYSGENDDYLEVLVREVPGGKVSKALSRVQKDDELEVQGPFGFFLLDPSRRADPHLLIATGTGISPFHSFVQSQEGLKFQLVHGIRTLEERYEASAYPGETYLPCLSQPAPEGGSEPIYGGRVTAWLTGQSLNPRTMVYLCGNCEMIYEVYDILKSRGHPGDQIFTEVYF